MSNSVNIMQWYELQQAQGKWQKDNFPPAQPYQLLLGIIEEVGEMEDAATHEDRLDAIGDIMIYMCSYCTSRNWEIQTIYNLATSKDSENWDWPSCLSIISKLAHHQLKSEQKIRGNEEKHSSESILLLAKLIRQLLDGFKDEKDFILVTNNVWQKVVSKRNWIKNPESGL